MARKDTLRELREIRDEERRVKANMPKRNRLIRKAATEGYTEAQIAEAAGKSPGRINQIKLSR